MPATAKKAAAKKAAAKKTTVKKAAAKTPPRRRHKRPAKKTAAQDSFPELTEAPETTPADGGPVVESAHRGEEDHPEADREEDRRRPV